MTLDYNLPVLAERDFERLSFMQMRCLSPEPSHLMLRLNEARILPASMISPSIVTMNSDVLIHDLSTSSLKKIKLVYPAQSCPNEGKISVDSNLGLALIGSRIGEVVKWLACDGRGSECRILSIPYQPESFGKEE